MAQRSAAELLDWEKPYDYTDFQRLVHAAPEDLSLFLGGGRGGAKSEFIGQICAVTSERHQQRARILYLRQGPYKSLNDIIETLSKIFSRFWGPKAHSLSRSSHVWTLPNGTYFELGILPDGEEGRKYYEKTYQGRSFTHIIVDEAQQWARADVLDLLVSNLRGPIPTRLIYAANPGGIGHQWIAKRFVLNGYKPWQPFRIERDIRVDGKMLRTSRTWIYCPSTYRDNPHNGPDYVANLAASCGHDLELLKAWLTGNWKISRGAYFASALDNSRIEIEWNEPHEWGDWESTGWRFWLSFDHGSAAPAAAYVNARSPGDIGPDGRFYPQGSQLLLDEWVCHRPGDLGKAFGWDVPTIAGYVKGLANRWNIPASGTADDACFGNTGQKNTIADEYAAEGVVWRPARKGLRLSRFTRMKRLFSACGRESVPGLYVSRRCHYFWATVPFIVHDPNDPEVPLKCDTDHGLDSVSYGLDGDVLTSGVSRNR